MIKNFVDPKRNHSQTARAFFLIFMNHPSFQSTDNNEEAFLCYDDPQRLDEALNTEGSRDFIIKKYGPNSVQLQRWNALTDELRAAVNHPNFYPESLLDQSKKDLKDLLESKN